MTNVTEYIEEIAYTDFNGNTHALDQYVCPKCGSELQAVDNSNGLQYATCLRCGYLGESI